MNLLRRVLFLSVLLVPVILAAQTTGSIQGTITDSTGAVVDGAICYSVRGVVDALTRWGIPLRGRIAA